MGNKSSPAVLVAGIGNTLRSDDGVAHFVCRQLEAMAIPGLEIREWQQLQLECIPVMQEYRAVIVVDAAVSGEAVGLEQVNTQEIPVIPSSHHLSASTLVSLANHLHLPLPPVWLCSIRTERLDLGEYLSPQAKERGLQAIDTILEWLRNLKD